MKKFIYSAFVLGMVFSFKSAHAQIATHQGFSTMTGGFKSNAARVMADGYTVRNVNSEGNVEGTPFVFQKWLPGKVFFVNGQSGDAEKLNFDAMDNVLVTQRDGVEMLFDQPIKAFELIDAKEGKRHFRKMNDNFYEVLAEGNVAFLKLYTKAAIESIPYGSSKPVVKISDEPQYFVVNSNNEFLPVKKDKSVLTLLSKNPEELSKFIKTDSINFKKEEDLVKLINYYNSL